MGMDVTRAIVALLLLGSAACSQQAAEPEGAPTADPSPAAQEATPTESALPYRRVGEVSTSTGQVVDIAYLLPDDATRIGMSVEPDTDFCVFISEEPGAYGGSCHRRATSPPDDLLVMGEVGSDVCVVHVATSDVSTASVRAGERHVPLERLPDRDELGASLFAACFEAPPGGVDDVELVQDEPSG